MTKREFLMQVAEMARQANNQEMETMALSLIEKMDEKNLNSRGKVSSKDLALRVQIQNDVIEVLRKEKFLACADIAKAIDVSTQRLTPRLQEMVDAGVITFITEKRKKLFSLADNG